MVWTFFSLWQCMAFLKYQISWLSGFVLKWQMHTVNIQNFVVWPIFWDLLRAFSWQVRYRMVIRNLDFSSFLCTMRAKRWAAEEFWMNVSVLKIEPVRMVKVRGDECRLHWFEDFGILLKEVITYKFNGSYLWIWFSPGLSLFNVGLLEGLPGVVFCAIRK